MNWKIPLVVLYTTLWSFSATVLGLAAARIHYTTNLSLGDPLNESRSFYDPIAAELLATSALTLIWCASSIYIIVRRNETEFRGESIGLSVLFVLWSVGAAIATSKWGSLALYDQFEQCRILTALVAFSWAAFAVDLIVLVISLRVFLLVVDRGGGESYALH